MKIPRKSALLLTGASIALLAGMSAAPAFAAGEAAEEIVVTARRKEENLQTVPIAITAFTDKQLKSAAVTSAFDLSRVVPGLSVQSSATTASNAVYNIRGRGTAFGVATGSVESYFADIPLSPPAAFPAPVPQFYDMASIQVLKGPQGTLFGRNTTGGAVLFVPQKPSNEFGGYFRAEGGNYSDHAFEGAVNVPIVKDKLMVRVAAYYGKRDGYTQSLGNLHDQSGTLFGPQQLNNVDEWSGRASVLFRPTDKIENLTIVTSWEDHNRSTPSVALVRPGRPTTGLLTPYLNAQLAAGPRTTNVDADLSRVSHRYFLIANTTKIDLNDNLTFKNIFGYMTTKGTANAPSDSDGTPLHLVNPFTPPELMRYHQTTDEVQLLGKAFEDRIDYTFGGMIDVGDTPEFPHADMFSSNFQNFNTYNLLFRHSYLESHSVYGSATVKLAPKWKFTFGARQTWDHVVDQIQRVTTVTANPAVGLFPFAFSQPTNFGLYPLSHKNRRFDGLSWNVGLDYQMDHDTLIYTNFRHGYKKGGFNAIANPGQENFDSEEVDSITAGVKSEFTLWGMHGRANVEGFYDFLKDRQTAFNGPVPPFGTQIVVSNVPQTVYRGVELDLMLQPTDWLEVSAYYSYLDAFNDFWYDTTAPYPRDLSANRVAGVVKNKVSITPRFHTELSNDMGEVVFAPTYLYTGSRTQADLNVIDPYATTGLIGTVCALCQGAGLIRPYSLINIRAEWNHVFGTGASIAANLLNVTNKVYQLGLTDSYRSYGESWLYGPPRMYTFEVRYDF